ncbi:hypothetical protein [Hydrogenophaga pseudoflava]|uniref:hypothetical protein n=1 Tax=Hydrogenophaga pseudoflava TaxID=47421 RepID=UPI0027E5B59A|nr:hypothetical protein [Hydrogenophaga pseudoflava]MDQ7745418.1 hypothetical protein [Hydrogenophaga pseudoflava]
MQIFDLKGTPRRAFSRGLSRGLGAPVLIYSSYDLPEELEPQYMPVSNPAAKTSGIKGDWLRVGHLIREAYKAHAPANG